jgi:hypothetical protein
MYFNSFMMYLDSLSNTFWFVNFVIFIKLGFKETSEEKNVLK